MQNRTRYLTLILLVAAIMALGTIGYMLIEGWGFNDAAYMTAITLSTVGFGEVRELTPAGRWFTIVLILLGVGLIVYIFSSLAESLFAISMEQELRKRRSRNMVKKVKDHVIICGFGQVGRSAASALLGSGQRVLAIDTDPVQVAAALDQGLLALQGDATLDDTLLEAGLERASGLVVCSGDDATNLFIVLSARALNPEVSIISRANQVINQDKLRRAGANRVVSPYEIGGRHMANIVIRPHVTDFFDVVTLRGGEEIWVEEQVIEPGSPLAGKTAVEADIRRRTGVTLIALYRHDTGLNVVPDADTFLQGGDQLIVLGTRPQLAALEKLTAPNGAQRATPSSG